MPKWFKGILQLAGFLIGAGLFVHVLSQAKPFELTQFINNLSASAWFLLFFYFGPYCLDTWGWIWVHGRQWTRRFSYWPASWIRLQGEAFNMITPGLDVGGEPLKIRLASKHFKIPKKILVSAMFVHRTLFLITAIPFIGLGVALFHYFFAGLLEIKLALLYGLLFYCTLTIAFMYLQQKNLYFKKTAYLGREIHRLYMHDTELVIKAAFFHFLSWVGNAVEAYLMLHVAGIPIGFLEALMLESLVQLVRTASCFIPGSLGAQEGAYAYLTQIMGFPAEAGLAISLFKRARQILWMLMGFGVWGQHRAIMLQYGHYFHKNSKRRAALPQGR